MTVALCTAACKAQSYSYAGLEYAAECYCGNSIGGTNGPAPDGLKGCNMPCNGNASEYCGGPNRLDMYKAGGTGGTSPPPAQTTAKPPAATSGTATALPSGWTYKGCYVDNANGRILSNQQPDSSTLTVEKCVASCVAAGYVVAGMEYGSQCFCGNGIANGGVLASSDTQCSMQCSGNSKETCGAGVSIFSHFSVGDGGEEEDKETEMMLKAQLAKRQNVSRTACRFIQKGHSMYLSRRVLKHLDYRGLGPTRAALLRAKMPESSSIKLSMPLALLQRVALPNARNLASWWAR